MTIERPIYQQIESLSPCWHQDCQPATQRIKSVLFSQPATPEESVMELELLWTEAVNRYTTPLVQTRAILPVTDESALINLCALRGATVSGKIPFRVNGTELAIYYAQKSDPRRRPYSADRLLDHRAAVNLGEEKLRSHRPGCLPEGYTVRVLNFSTGSAVDLLTQEDLGWNLDSTAAEIARVNSLAFAYHHDPAQATPEGAKEILAANPTLVAVDPDGQIASVGYWEQDPRFTYHGLVLVEPTYFTHPDVRYRRQGLSSCLRQVTRRLVEISHTLPLYHYRPVIVFNESIRSTSFPLCLENGFFLAANSDRSIPGDLGEAYTAIGPANPESGLMPMGLTYFVDSSIQSSSAGLWN